METAVVVVDGLTKLQEFGAIITLFTVIVAALLLDRWQVAQTHKAREVALEARIDALTDKFLTSVNESNDKFIGVSIEMTKAVIEFKEVLRDVSRGQ